MGYRSIRLLTILVVVGLFGGLDLGRLPTSLAAGDSGGPKNILLFIGDGMGFEEVKAARYYQGSPLAFELLPYQAQMTTASADNPVTDSAASATAMATGFKVNNGVISLALPGDGHELETLVEYFRSQGRRTGLVTTTFMTHATPAAFGAHTPDRNNYSDIAGDYLTQTQPDILFGGGANGLSVGSAETVGYSVVTDTATMQALNTLTETKVSGQFGNTHLPYEADGLGNLPHLHEMTATALAILENSPNGFFLMVEGGRIDHAGHINDLARNVLETVEFGRAVQTGLDWAQGRTDTLILVTADHETGGLQVLQDNGPGNLPTVSWSTLGHTGVNVPVYGWGMNGALVQGVLDNTDIYRIIMATSPAAPTDLSGQVTATNWISLLWVDQADNEDNFELERSLTGGVGPFTLLAALPVDTTTYLDTGLAADRQYCYRVRAVNVSGGSTDSEVLCLQTLPTPIEPFPIHLPLSVR